MISDLLIVQLTRYCRKLGFPFVFIGSLPLPFVRLILFYFTNASFGVHSIISGEEKQQHGVMPLYPRKKNHEGETVEKFQDTSSGSYWRTIFITKFFLGRGDLAF